MKCGYQGEQLIKHYEGLRLRPYQCQAGVWTIGYGHTSGIGPSADQITEQQADLYLQADLARCNAAVNRLIKPVTQLQFDALVCFTFNLGAGALQRSTLRQKVNRGDYQGAAKEFLKWVRANGKVSAGLVARRRAERALFLAGTPSG